MTRNVHWSRASVRACVRVCVCACVCVSVCLSVCPSPKLLHGPRCNFGELQGVPPSCALLDGFAIDAPFSLLWQHSAELAVCLVTKFEVHSIAWSKDRTGASKFKSRSPVLDHDHLGLFGTCTPKLGLSVFRLCEKAWSFAHIRGRRRPENLKRSRMA